MRKVDEADRILRRACLYLGPEHPEAVGIISRILLSFPIPREPKSAEFFQKYAEKAEKTSAKP